MAEFIEYNTSMVLYRMQVITDKINMIFKKKNIEISGIFLHLVHHDARKTAFANVKSPISEGNSSTAVIP